MKFVFEKTLVDQLLEAQALADEKNKTIDRVEVTCKEADTLRDELGMHKQFVNRLGFFGMVCGVRVFVVKDSDF